MKESDSGCKGCASCSCKDANTEDAKLSEDGHYTAPSGAVYEIGKEYFAEPGKVYVNDYGVFLAEEYWNASTYYYCRNCCAWQNIHDEGDDEFVSKELVKLCGILPSCAKSYNVIFKCLQSNYDWLKVSEIKGAE